VGFYYLFRWDWYIKITNLFKNTAKRRASKINPHFAAPASLALNCQKWKVAPAPVPSEIIWKNLENSKKKKTGLQILALIVEVVVLTSVLSVTLLFAIIEVVRDLYLTGYIIKYNKLQRNNISTGQKMRKHLIARL
jgi:hypothetical protein